MNLNDFFGHLFFLFFKDVHLIFSIQILLSYGLIGKATKYVVPTFVSICILFYRDRAVLVDERLFVELNIISLDSIDCLYVFLFFFLISFNKSIGLSIIVCKLIASCSLVSFIWALGALFSFYKLWFMLLFANITELLSRATSIGLASHIRLVVVFFRFFRKNWGIFFIYYFVNWLFFLRRLVFKGC